MGLLHWFRGWSARKPASSGKPRHRPDRKRPLRTLGVEQLEDRVLLSVVNWTNPNGGNWDTASNWSTGSLPGAGDDVVIGTAAAATITIQSGDTFSVHGLTTTSSDTLSITGGSLSVAANATLSGSLSMTGGSLTASGAGVIVLVNGTTSVSAASLYAQGGAALSLPNLTSYTGNGSTNTLEATGTGSTLTLANLAGVTETANNYPASVQFEALAGGTVTLSALRQLNTGTVVLESDGAASTLNVSTLTSFAEANGWTYSTLQSSNGGTVGDGSLASLVNVNLNVGGTGENLTLSGLTSFATANLTVSGGASLSLPGLTSYTGNGTTTTLEATGTGSTLTLANLATVTEAANNFPATVQFEALAGGTVTLPALPQLNTGTVVLESDGTGSVLNVSALTGFTETNGWSYSTLQVSNGGTVDDGSLASLANVNLNVAGTGENLTLGGLTSFATANLTVSGGASLSLPGLTSYAGNTGTTTLEATGAGSTLTLANLATVTEAANNFPATVQFEALAGGTVTLPALPQLNTGTVVLESDGAGSVLNVSALTSFTETNGWTYSTLQSSSGGTVDDGSLASLANVNLNVSGTAEKITLGSLTSFATANLTVSGGASLSLPGLTSYAGNTGTTTLEATGTGSTLTLANLTSLVGSTTPGARTLFEALAGGTVTLSAVTQISGGSVTLESDGAGSTLNVSNLTTLTEQNAGYANNSVLQVTNGGTVASNSLTTLRFVTLTLDGTGNWASSQLTSSTDSYLTLSGGTLTFSALTDFDRSSILASGGASLSLPGVTSYAANQGYLNTLEATGAGSTLTLANLATLSVTVAGTQVQLEALAGGTVALPGLMYVTGGPVTLKADGTGSVVNVSNLTHFNSTGGTVAVTNNGTIEHPAPGTGGSLTLNTATSGAIAAANAVNDWTFLGQAGQGITLTVVTGSQGFPNSWPPNLNFAQVSLTDNQGNVLASANNTQSGASVTLQGVALPAVGVYHVLVQAPQSQPGVTGDYVLTVADVTVHQFALPINQTVHGSLDSASSVDHWTLSAAANTQVQFNLVAAANSATQFDLTGPNGYTAFSGLTGNSSLLTLPSAGNYVLTVHNAPGAYAFNLQQTSQTALALGTPFQGNLAGSGQAQLFKVTVTNPGPLLVTLTDANAADHNEVYVQEGAPPTRDTYDVRSTTSAAANQEVVLQARPGTYYVLVYDDYVQAPGSFTVEAQSAPFIVTGMTPNRSGNGSDATLQFTGAFAIALQAAAQGQGMGGVQDNPTVQFVAGDGTVYPPSPLPVYFTGSEDADGLPVVAVTVPANTLPPGTYSVRLTDDSNYSVTLSTPYTVVQGGLGIHSCKGDPVAELLGISRIIEQLRENQGVP